MRATPFVLAVVILGLLVTPGDAAQSETVVSCNPDPFPVATSITLANSLLNCPDDALVVVEDGVTIDLNGHTLDGQATGTGISSVGNTKVKIVNGIVKNFSTGIQLEGGSKHSVSEVFAIRNKQVGIRVKDSQGVKIEESQTIGIVLGSEGINIEGGSGHKLKENVIAESDSRGLVLDATTAFNKIEGNYLISNNGRGLVVEGDNNTFSKNLVGANKSDGVYVATTAEGNTFKSNDVKGNGRPAFSDHGILVEGDLNVFQKNESTSSTGDGFNIAASADGTNLTSNIANYNDDDGIDDGGTNTTGSGNITIGNGGLPCDPPNPTLCPSP